MLCNGGKTHFFGFIYALHIIFLYGHNSFICRIPMLEEIYAISGMMFRLEVIHG